MSYPKGFKQGILGHLKGPKDPKGFYASPKQALLEYP